jgi:uncharacterized protein YbcC (UPF0753/DUF2309 family)
MLSKQKPRGVDSIVRKVSTMKPAKKRTQKSPKSTPATGKKPTGFTDQERVAMRERL